MSEQKRQPLGAAGRWQCGLAFYCGVLLVILLGLVFWEYTSEEHAVELTPYEALMPEQEVILVNINKASAVELDALPRIGPVLAQAIIDHRTEYGPFESLEQLMDVPGIGEKTFEEIRGLVSLE